MYVRLITILYCVCCLDVCFVVFLKRYLTNSWNHPCFILSDNSKRREQYHRQSENSRQRRRERERSRYHSLDTGSAKDRNNRRAKLERERYQRLSAEDLESKNRKRRERAATSRQKKAEARGDAPGDDAAAAAAKDKPDAAPEVTAAEAAAALEDAVAAEAKQAAEAAAAVGEDTVAAAVEAAKEAVEKAAVVSI